MLEIYHIDECYNFFDNLILDPTNKYIAKNVLKEIKCYVRIFN